MSVHDTEHAVYRQADGHGDQNDREGAPALPALPIPVGPLSAAVTRALRPRTEVRPRPLADLVTVVEDPLTHRDFQLALWMLYELHYRGFAGVDPAFEWDPLLIAARRVLEQRFEAALRALVGPPDTGPAGVGERLLELTRPTTTPELAEHLADTATESQFRDYLGERAVYQLRESDPQSFLLPRLDGAVKARLAELQYDEYGAGRPERLHATLFARALESVGMATSPTPYARAANAATLASMNTMSFFCLHRRLRGAGLGHFAAYEATSAVPCARIAAGARRLGLPPAVADYYDEHVEADSVHEQLAVRGIAGAFADQHPEEATEVLFGMAAGLAVDGRAAATLLGQWRRQSQHAGAR